VVADPVGFAKLIENPAANWLYSSEPDEGTGQRRIPIPRGKLLGGSSSINGMVFVRGQSHDYDSWAQLGNRGWSYREVRDGACRAWRRSGIMAQVPVRKCNCRAAELPHKREESW